MTAHKHAEMIKAKADNMELVVFVKNSNTNEWWEVFGDIPFNQQQDFFLCLPQHKEACLHWLNGVDIEFFECEKWHTINSKITWGYGHLFMSEIFKIRIKPRKEKRWIAIDVKNGDVCLCTESSAAAPNYQIVEIEVEVQP